MILCFGLESLVNRACVSYSCIFSFNHYDHTSHDLGPVHWSLSQICHLGFSYHCKCFYLLISNIQISHESRLFSQQNPPLPSLQISAAVSVPSPHISRLHKCTLDTYKCSCNFISDSHDKSICMGHTEHLLWKINLSYEHHGTWFKSKEKAE